MPAEIGTSWTSIRIEWDVYLTSPNPLKRIRDFRSKSALQNRSKAAAVAGWMLAGQPRAEGPVVFSVSVGRGRALDDDAVVGGLKWIRDALFNGRVTVNDSPRWVRFEGVRQSIRPEFKGQEWIELWVRLDSAEDAVRLALIEAQAQALLWETWSKAAGKDAGGLTGWPVSFDLADRDPWRKLAEDRLIQRGILRKEEE